MRTSAGRVARHPEGKSAVSPEMKSALSGLSPIRLGMNSSITSLRNSWDTDRGRYQACSSDLSKWEKERKLLDKVRGASKSGSIGLPSFILTSAPCAEVWGVGTQYSRNRPCGKALATLKSARRLPQSNIPHHVSMPENHTNCTMSIGRRITGRASRSYRWLDSGDSFCQRSCPDTGPHLLQIFAGQLKM